MLDAHFLQLYFLPQLKHAAARIACDNGPTCSFLSLVPLVVTLHAKFEVYSSNRSRHMEGFPKFQK